MARFEHFGVVVTPQDFVGADWIALCQKHHLRTLGLHSGGGASADVRKMLGEYGTEAFRRRVAEAGLECEYECHASASLLPPSLFEEHPEYFAYDMRRRARRCDSNWCVTNPEAQEVFRKNAEELVRDLPSGTHRYLLWNADSPRVYCHCPNCAKLSPSDQTMLAVNLLARAARAVDPLATVPYLAYKELMEPPAVIQPDPNVFLEFAPIDRCLLHPLQEPDCHPNRVACRQLQLLLQLFPARTAHVLEYHLDASLFSNWKRPAVPVPTTREVMERDFDFYASLGIRSFTSFAVFMDGDFFQKYGDQALATYAELHATHSLGPRQFRDHKKGETP